MKGNIVLFICGLFFWPLSFLAQNALPRITNLHVTYDSDHGIADVYYDLHDPDDSDVGILLQVLDPTLLHFVQPVGELQGDIGSSVRPGPRKHISWQYKNKTMESMRLRLIADDFYKMSAKDLKEEPDTFHLSALIKLFQGERNYFSPSSEEKIKKVQTDITHAFDKINVRYVVQDTILEDFEIQKGIHQRLPIENIIGEIPGTNPDAQAFIVSSHYDTDTASFGINDHATGLAAMLEVARLISQYSFAHSIRFAAFDLSKSGFLGSRFYAMHGDHQQERIAGILNIDAIERYSEIPNSQLLAEGANELFPDAVNRIRANQYVGDFVALIANGNSKNLMHAWMEVADNDVRDLKVITFMGNNISREAALRISDHSIFWRLGVPAITVTDTGDLRSIPDGRDSRVNYAFISRIIKASVLALMQLGEIRHCTILEFELKNQ